MRGRCNCNPRISSRESDVSLFRISTGGSSGGVGGVATPPLIFKKKNSGHPRGRCDRFTRVAVVIDLVIVTSSNSARLCALNSVAV